MKPPPTFLLLLLLLFLTAITASSAAVTPKANITKPATSPTHSPTSAVTPKANTTKPGTSPTPSPISSPIPPTTTPSSSSTSTLDPKEIQALESLNIPTIRDPCIQPSPHNATICDPSKPFRHLISLQLSNCSSDLSLSFTALKSLSSLHSLSFSNCHVPPTRFPANLALSLTSFSCIHSLRHLTGVWLSRLQNLTDLTVSYTPVNTSGLYVILGNMKKLKSFIHFAFQSHRKSPQTPPFQPFLHRFIR